MAKIITDNSKIKSLLERGVENVFVKEELEKKLNSGKKLTVYLGIDPTGPTLHMGHAIPIRKLKEFQDLGHQVILLMGDFTAMIGDPDKKQARKPLTHKEVMKNLKKYKKQASTFLKFTGPNKAQFKFNSKWLGKMKFEDVLNLASHMTVDQMLKRDMFKTRMEEQNPIYIHEFLYPLMQGYDSVAMKVDVEIGGNDQTFNMLTGRNLSSQLINKEKTVIATKLLVDNTGKKMGKTEGNMITLEDGPKDMFGKVMSWEDSLIVNGFELCTSVSMEEIRSIENLMKMGKNPMEFKMKLGYEIVKTFFNEKKAIEARDEFINTFQKGEIPEEMTEIKLNKEVKTLMDLLVRDNILSSKGEFRRLVSEGAVTDLDTDEKVNNVNLIPNSGMRFKIGKRRFVKIV
ncbi:MAG: tyrosine--tRNA ligase [Patescibacteria group bacterium]